ncbi:carbohydrate ABC transporter permease [Cellulosimicrobium cellulans]|uniref:carbohydrate ABC transporter permease n=1 Tax=Cellulosimicrobium cellulans TaxID=1710 RepID=UPI0020982B5B|nr:carbohydrate ABC transporter permease [Cellulosimicrobium cellulans]MCO7274237.1 carbohydrate ABC transporter permease [Cellulosimicrobium cellulans]
MTLSPTDNPSEIGVVSQDSAASADSTPAVPTDGTGTARRAAEASRSRRESERRRVRARRRKALDGVEDRGALSEADWRRPSIRWGMGSTHVLLLVILVVAGLGPMLLLAKYAVTPTQDILRTPMAIFPNGIAWDNLDKAWNDVQVSRYFLNTIWLAVGSWASQILVATTGGYALSVLRPKYGKVVQALVLSTMFVPAIVLLVPLYLTILDPPLLGRSLINSFWAVWLPAGASAFNVLLVQRFFDSLPREVFEAARMDGAGPYRLFWSIVLPMSKPIIGVVSVFAVIAAWKDFLWPLLVLKDPAIQPLSVRLPSIEASTDLGVFLAALAISTLIPVGLFLVFQRMFLQGAGLGGAVKG